MVIQNINKRANSMVWGGKKSTSADTNSFPVYERLPSIGGIGPTSSFSLRSLKHNFAQKNSLRAKKKKPTNTGQSFCILILLTGQQEPASGQSLLVFCQTAYFLEVTC
jgi:hypothetical protein